MDVMEGTLDFALRDKWPNIVALTLPAGMDASFHM
jgi:hypothetical protein